MLSADGQFSCGVLVHNRGVCARQFAHLGHTLARQADCGGMPQRGFCARQVMLNMRVGYIFGHAHYAMIPRRMCQADGFGAIGGEPISGAKNWQVYIWSACSFLCKKVF
jgi:hypothetical protein